MANKNAPQLVAPFLAERFSSLERLGRFLSPPYDVINDQRRATLAAEDHNIVHLILPEGNGDRYNRAKLLYQEWKREGVIVADSSPGVYVVRQDFTTPDGKRHSRTGFIGALAVEPYSTRRVRRHEETHQGPKQDRLALMRSTNAMFEALLMLSDDEDGQLSGLLSQATSGPRVARAELDGVAISMWHVTGRDAKRIANAAGNDAVYVADGHHRFETAVAFHKERPVADRTLALIVPTSDPGLVVLPTHRIIGGGAISEGQLRLAVGEIYEVVSIDSDSNLNVTMERIHERGGGCVVILPNNQYFVLTEKTDSTLPRFTPAQDTAIMRLDVARADTLVIEPLRRVAGSESTLAYSADVADVKAQVAAGAAAGVLVTPTSLSEVISVADEGGVMPRKSTFFYPKVPSGLVILSWR